MTSRKRIDDQGYPDHILRWLDGAMRRVTAEIVAAWPDNAGPRASHRRALSMIGTQGVRITDLATRAAMTKQAAGELVDGLERDGLARSERDPHDGRVRLVLRTPLGDEAVEETLEKIAGVEAKLRREVGARRYDDALEVLRQLGSHRPGE
jgi:DNA-binding MarR family transcriptional regulator